MTIAHIIIILLGTGVGMMIGMGGASLISRSLGVRDFEKAERTLGNAILWTSSKISTIESYFLLTSESILRWRCYATSRVRTPEDELQKTCEYDRRGGIEKDNRRHLP